jgi:RHS repeat-associated protein
MSGRTVFACLLTVISPFAVLAQNGPDNDPDGLRGYVDNVFHHGQVDSVNLYNGLLTVPIALGPRYPVGPKLKFQVMLTYGSRVNEYGHPSATNPDYTYFPFAGDPALGLGWTFTVGAIKNCGGVCYVAADGSQHIFNTPVAGSSAYLKTSDGTQGMLHDLGNGGPYEMWDADGNHSVFDWHVTGNDDPPTSFTHDFGRGRDGWYLTSLSDPFGNGFTVTYRNNVLPVPCAGTYSATCSTLQMRCLDTGNSWIPRTINLPTGTITVGMDSNSLVNSFTFPVVASGVVTTATWTLGYQLGSDAEGSSIQTCDDQAGTEYTFNPWLLKSIQMPAGAGSFLFTYGKTTNCLSNVLSQAVLPTGATVDYLYGTYSFYHGRLAFLNQNCSSTAPDASAVIQLSGSLCCAASCPAAPRPLISGRDCGDHDPERFLDQQSGVVRRTETFAGDVNVTDYVQFAFPFGENGTSPASNCDGIGRCGPQSLTVVVSPAEKDGKRRARGVLFWSGPRNGGSATYSGDRTGADIEERVYEGDPTQNVDISAMPACGGSRLNPFCADRAVRVTQRTYEYDIASSDVGNRRLFSEIVYHQPPAANGVCSGCRYHQVSFANAGSHTWEGNGRHYDSETQTGNLGADYRQVTTAWTPAYWSAPPPSNAFSLPNLMSQRTESDGSTAVYRYFEYRTDATANGFLLGSAIWDSGRQRTFLSCFYNDGRGNVGREFSATYPNQLAPPNNACQAAYPSFPTGGVGVNGDAFGKIHTYQNGLLVTSRWMATPFAPGNWFLRNFVRDPGTGWVTSSSDAANLTTSYQYDSVGRVTLIAPPGGEAPIVVGYPLATRTVATRNGGAGLFTYQQYEYDGLGRVARDIHQMPGINQYAVRTHAYDGAGHRYFDSEWMGCSSGAGDCLTAAPGGTTSSDFDPYGRAQTTARADGSTSTVSFADSYSSFSDTKKTVTINNLGGVCAGGTCTGGSAAQTSYISDAFGRLASVTEPDSAVTSYSYDVNGRLTRVAQPGLPDRTFDYDTAGFLRQETAPEKGTVTYGDYGSLGNLLTKTENDGTVISYLYDFAGRLACEGQGPVVTGGGPCPVNQSIGSLYVVNSYDGNGFSGGSYPLGRITQRKGYNPLVSGQPSFTDNFTYSNAAGRLSRVSTIAPGGLGQVDQGWSYNGLGLVAQHNHARPANGSAASFAASTAYDAGLPATLYVNGIPAVTGIAFAPSQALRSYTTGLFRSRTVTTTIAPDASLLPRPASIATVGASTNFATGAYSYDSAGNITAMGQDSFAYDSRSRLTSAALSGVGDQSFSYDRFGNLVAKSGTPGNTTLCSGTCVNNKLLNSVAAYDNRGNLTTNWIAPGGPEIYTFDSLNRQIAHQASGLTWSYLYDGDNERIARILPSGWTYTFRDESRRVSAEFGATGPSRDNVFLDNLLAVSFASAAGNDRVWAFCSSDHLGTPRLITDVAASTVEAPRNWPYGESATTQGVSQRIRFASMERDTEGSRYYDHARSHEFNLARFLSPDKVGGTAADPQGWNRYSYVLNNPLKHVDPDGNLTIVVHGTFARGSADFLPGGAFFQNVARTVHDRTVASFQWSGKNSHEARVGAAKALAAFIRDYQFAPGEQLNIVGHSHAGNVAIAAINMGLGRPVDNLITLGTPSRSGYRLLEPSRVSNWINVYDSFDKVQTHGGGNYVSSFQTGPAARTEPGALNLNWNIDFGPLDSHSALYSPAAWQFTAPHLHPGTQWTSATTRVVSE